MLNEKIIPLNWDDFIWHSALAEFVRVAKTIYGCAELEMRYSYSIIVNR